jgi:pimeloyl-ACP methyl ester carboxylesterase
MASLHTWEGWVAALDEHYRLVTLDLPAHGLTGAAPVGAEKPYGSEGFTKAIHAVTEALGLTSFVLGGNSMGGGATWRYTLAYPERVSAMILVNAVPPNRDWGQTPSTDGPKASEQKAPPVGFSLLRQSWFRTIARYFDPGLLIEQGLRSAYNDSPVVNEALVDRYYELMMREGTRGAILARTGGWNSAPVDLSRLTQPTLIMWGAMDSVIPVSVAYQFKAHMPNNCTIVYPDLGHIPMEESPARTAADVSGFLTHHFEPQSQSRRPIQTCLE